MYLKYLDGEALSVDKLKDPFWDPIDDVFLGRLVTPWHSFSHVFIYLFIY